MRAIGPAVAGLLVVAGLAITSASDGPASAATAATGATGVLPVVQTVVGRSVLGRPITLARLGEPEAARKVLVVGAIHGDEAAGRAVVDRLLADAAVPAGAQLLLVRSMNPDAVARGTRLNAHGVDLNRNSSDRFGRRQPPGSSFPPGPRAFSEPETRALHALILRERPDAVVWYHQPLGLVDLPEAGSPVLAVAFARRVGLPVKPLRRRPGSMSAWVNSRVRPGASWVVELPPGRMTVGAIARHARALRAVAAGG